MKNLTVWQRLMYISAGLVFLVVLLLGFAVIPHIRMDESITEFADGAIRGTFFVSLIHLLFLILLIGAIISSFRRGKAIKGLLIVSGIFLILLGLLISDGGFSYIDSPSSRPTAIYIFICVGFDLIAGILAFVAIYKRRKLISVK